MLTQNEKTEAFMADMLSSIEAIKDKLALIHYKQIEIEALLLEKQDIADRIADMNSKGRDVHGKPVR
ncbi:UNVERIFIED_ORG: hypothetical protein LHK14_03760 [Roseateles sp. XES5]|nr:hypothetical protein [Roseateles sp. XES5]